MSENCCENVLEKKNKIKLGIMIENGAIKFIVPGFEISIKWWVIVLFIIYKIVQCKVNTKN